jgi:hypothetical protein
MIQLVHVLWVEPHRIEVVGGALLEELHDVAAVRLKIPTSPHPSEGLDHQLGVGPNAAFRCIRILLIAQISRERATSARAIPSS